MLKKSASGVLALLRPSTYPIGYAAGSSLAAALLDDLFEHLRTVFLFVCRYAQVCLCGQENNICARSLSE